MARNKNKHRGDPPVLWGSRHAQQLKETPYSTHANVPRPDWMDDPSLLPKKPPMGRP